MSRITHHLLGLPFFEMMPKRFGAGKNVHRGGGCGWGWGLGVGVEHLKILVVFRKHMTHPFLLDQN